MSPQRIEDRRPPITPQLALRVAILGGFAFVLFAIIFFRLWFLQILSGDDYVSQAAQNRFRSTRIEAPRGAIVDRNGIELVRSRQAPVVKILPDELPEAEREAAAAYGEKTSAAERERLAAAERARAMDRVRRREKRKFTPRERAERKRLARAARQARKVPLPPLPQDPDVRGLYSRLGRVIEMRPREIHRRVVQQVAMTPYAAVTVKTDIPVAAYNYLRERQHLFPGVEVEKQYLREYPHEDLAAHIFGTIGEISPDELKLKRYRGVEQGERIGKSGVEYAYDRYLRGESGYFRQVVNALGEACRECPERRVDPQQGYKLELTLDLGLQRAGQKALERAIAGVYGATAGGFVALDPFTGEVLALGSVPSFDANLFAKPISQERFDALNNGPGKPLYNRAIAGIYPTGSTFKLITATAALEEGVITPTTPIHDDGSFEAGAQVFKNAGDAVFGTINVVEALKVSSDVFFYTLGNNMNPMPGQKLQTWARNMGLGKPTGIDIPGEFGGLVPDSKWRNEGFRKYQRCVKRENLEHGSIAALYECGGIERPWSVGDNINLAVGQGDLQATPLQMAVAYSTLVNGGEVVEPQLGNEVEDGEGATITRIEKPPRRKLGISESTRTAIMEGLRQAAMDPGGTSAGIFGDFPLTVYGKTGTAERPPNPDQSWYVAYVNANKRPIVVAVTVEGGGFGAEAAAPATCRILAHWYDLKADCQAQTTGRIE